MPSSVLGTAGETQSRREELENYYQTGHTCLCRAAVTNSLCDLRQVLALFCTRVPSVNERLSVLSVVTRTCLVMWNKDIRSWQRARRKALDDPAASDCQGGQKTSSEEMSQSSNQRSPLSQSPPFFPEEKGQQKE